MNILKFIYVIIISFMIVYLIRDSFIKNTIEKKILKIEKERNEHTTIND